MKTEFKPFDRTQDDYATRAIFKNMYPTIEKAMERSEALHMRSKMLIKQYEKSIKEIKCRNY